MKYIRPYGSSVVTQDEKSQRKRILAPKTNLQAKNNIDWEPPKSLAFWNDDPEFLIAQWISVIDKIFNKPHEALKDKINENCSKHRISLGKIAWNHIQKTYKIPNALKALWDGKINARQKKYPFRIEGRCYQKFAAFSLSSGKEASFPPCRLNDAVYKQITLKIESHLLKGALRWGSQKEKQKGYIELQAKAIENNILKEKDFSPKNYQKKDFEIYKDVVTKIKSEIEKNLVERLELENALGDRNKQKEKKVNLKKLREQESPYHTAIRLLKKILTEKLYPNKEEYQKEIKDEKEPSDKFKIYQDVCALYKKLLKNPKLKTKDLKNKIGRNLPKDAEALFQRIQHENRNKDINYLIRLGKIIHYTESKNTGSSQDRTDHIINNSLDPKDIGESFYWSTDGQIIIKQNEAFVRVFRTAIAFAARTFDDWVDPRNEIKGREEGQNKDILMQKKEACDKLKIKDFDEKAYTLFGDSLQNLKDSQKKELSKAIGNYLYNLRNASFHFKGLSSFITSLDQSENPREKELLPEKYKQAFDIMRKLYKTDNQKHGEFIKKTMEASHFHYFFSQNILERFHRDTLNAKPSALGLPSFKNILKRVENAWDTKNHKINLPPYPTSEELEAKTAGQIGNWKLAQYSFLKMLYDRPFKNWLEENGSSEKIHPFIKKAIERSTEEAKRLNEKEKNKEEELISARAEKIDLPKTDDPRYLETFLYKLTSETASEMRVQKGYESNPEKAKKQSEYIENLKKDVIAQAFENYLSETLGKEEFDKLVQKEPQSKEKLNQKLAFNIPDKQIEGDTPEDWMYSFYFFLHLIPNQISNDLCHQLIKWSIVIGKRNGKKILQEENEREAGEETKFLKNLLSLFTLYFDMSSAQFDNLLKDKKELIALTKNYFESEELCQKTLDPNSRKTAKTETTEDHLPLMKRLREMIRFGKNYTLQPILEKHKITQSQFHKWKALKENISEHQKKLKKLHESWETKKSNFSENEHLEYQNALKEVENYRHLNAHILLQDHVRLFQLTVRILGRLLDYSGLWERNLYFTLLALIYKNPILVEDWKDIPPSFEETLKNGEIVSALSILEENCPELFSLKKIMEYIDISKKNVPDEENLVTIRNRLAHFAMLHDENFNLTKEINQTRNLMAHDRKLKNAVSKSIKELLEREGLDLTWQMSSETEKHNLSFSTLEAKKIYHLKKGKGKSKIIENAFDDKYLSMVREIF